MQLLYLTSFSTTMFIATDQDHQKKKAQNKKHQIPTYRTLGTYGFNEKHHFGLSPINMQLLYLTSFSTTMFIATDQDHQNKKKLSRKLLSCRKCSGNSSLLIIFV